MEPNKIEKLTDEVDQLLSSPKAEDHNGISKNIVNAISQFLGDGDGKQKRSLATVIKRLDNETTENARLITILLVRSMDCHGVIVNTNNVLIESPFVELFVKKTPDLAKHFGIDAKDQTFRSISILEAAHSQMCQHISSISAIPASLKGIVDQRKEIMKAINFAPTKSYFNAFGIKPMQTAIREVVEACSDIDIGKDVDFFSNLKRLKAALTEADSLCDSRTNILYQHYFRQFINTVQSALSKVEAESEDRFRAELRPLRTGIDTALKKYPLYEKERTLIIEIPIHNSGNGTAVDTKASVECEDESLVFDDTVSIGEVPKGTSTLCIYAIVNAPTEKCKLHIRLSWRSYIGEDRRFSDFECALKSQAERNDWTDLEFEEPYSTEVAKGEEFVGRRSKIASLVKRINRSRMQSSYVCGQKRVGKTSLVSAAKDTAKARSNTFNLHFLFLEWGDYSNPSSIVAIDQLARKIYMFFSSADKRLQPDPPEFQGSLSPLADIAYLLKMDLPDDRFVIVLDEFDEIHPDMYRHGPLAETFFSNLRSLSSKDNLAFILVGGENMPFIISAQGDQLNKFAYEPLSYFDRSREWKDYEELITRPTDGILSWHSDSIAYLYRLTNGHPYYTKLICGEVYVDAVEKRDSEICFGDVEFAVKRLISDLDTNSFSHFWKDGIQSGNEEEKEAISLKRIKLILAICDALKHRSSATKEDIFSYGERQGMDRTSLENVLGDFLRREVIRQEAGFYQFSVPFFQEWIMEKGHEYMVPDTLGDVFLESSRKKEDELRITSKEVVEFARELPTYRGRKISDEKVRAWIEQITSLEDQRLLFDLARHVELVSVDKLAESLRSAHAFASKQFPANIIKSKIEKRKDIAVVYVDGEGKSGQLIARRYAEHNRILVKCISDGTNFQEWVDRTENDLNITLNGLVVVDDVSVTGRSLSSNLNVFLSANHAVLKERNMHVVVAVAYGTDDSRKVVEETLDEKIGETGHYFVCNDLDDRYSAFTNEPGFWGSIERRDKAKALCRRIGSKVYPKHPLGYGDKALLIVFPDNCPNNSLPLLYAHGKRDFEWQPIFERAMN